MKVILLRKRPFIFGESCFFFFTQVIFFFFLLQCTRPQLADSTVIMARARSEHDFSLCFRADPLATVAAPAEAAANYSHFVFFFFFK